MDTALEKSTCVGLGYASRADAFQSGREAAQMAKGQLPDGPFDLVLAFGPSTIHFKDFVEGVRLVTGEECLLGIPTARVLAGNQAPPENCAVLILQSSSSRFSLACNSNAPPLAAATALLTQFREARGNIRDQFEHHGILLVDAQPPSRSAMAALIAADAGLESQVVAISTRLEKNAPLVCRNTSLTSGSAGMEWLSHTNWGIGTVGVGAFLNQPDILRNAVKTAWRDASAQRDENAAAFGLLLIDLPVDRISEDDIPGIFEHASATAKNMPLVGLVTSHLSLRCPGRFPLAQKNSVAVLLVPK